MTIAFMERASESPYVDTITHGFTLSAGAAIRPAEYHWHMVFVKHTGGYRPLVVGPWTAAGEASWGEGAEIIWVRFKPGIFMPHLPVRKYLDCETVLPEAAGKTFWLNGSAWQFPDHENVDTFINRLMRQEVLVHDPVVEAVLQGHRHDWSARTVRHRFLNATGLTHNHIQQVERAQRAADLLTRGVSILDTVHEAGYFDQPHLTRSLKRFIGRTPGEQLAQVPEPA